MDYLSRAEVKKQFIEQGSSWVAQQQFWLFGTATYKKGIRISREKAESNIKYFFNMLDRKIICRKDYNEKRRLQRLVFIERGKTGEDTHMHFYIKGRQLKDYRKIKLLCEELWTTKIHNARDIEVLDNIEHNTARKNYCWKELHNEQYAHEQKIDWHKFNKGELLAADVITTDILLLECCHID